jgi:hypothetical protein
MARKSTRGKLLEIYLVTRPLNKTALILFLLISVNGFAQADSLKYNFIVFLAKDLNKYYVCGSLAKQISDSIILKYKTGGYDTATNMDEFAYDVTKDLRRLSNDHHITVNPSHSQASPKPESVDYENLTTKQLKKRIEKNKILENRYVNSLSEDLFKYGEIKILPGNVGYVEIKTFGAATIQKRKKKDRIKIESVFQYLKSSSNLIIDLRNNNGGLTNMAAKFCSYFANSSPAYFITEESHLRYDSSGIERNASFKNRYYTESGIRNDLTKGKGIYILVGDRTFSAAELTAYKIKQFIPAAIIIGQKTRGGGNGYPGLRENEYYTAIIPSSKSFDEENNTHNIEGLGVTPDITCPDDSVLGIAYRLARVINSSPDASDVKYFRRVNQMEPRQVIGTKYAEYAGNYRKVEVYTNNGCLYLLYDTFFKTLLMPVENDVFVSEEFESIRFLRDTDSKIIEVQLKHKDGYLEKFRRLAKDVK